MDTTRIVLADIETIKATFEPLIERIEKAIATADHHDPGERLRVDEAAALLHVTPAALRKRCARGDVKFERLGRALRFKRGDLLALAAGSASK